MTKGKFIIIDGLDGCGKSTIIRSLSHYLRKRGKEIFDFRDYWTESHSLPEPEELYGYDVILTAEPTFSLIGAAIRQEFIKDNLRHYSALETATAFSLDRLVLYRRIIIPLLKKGKTIIQDRSVTTSIIYQPIQAEPLHLGQVLSLEGNKLALTHGPDLLIIVNVNPRTCLKRLAGRGTKKDQVIFENLDFQQKAYERFMSPWFKHMFEGRGSKVVYLDANKTKEEVIGKSISVYKQFIEK